MIAYLLLCKIVIKAIYLHTQNQRHRKYRSPPLVFNLVCSFISTKIYSPSPDKAVVEDSKMNEKDWNNISDTKKMLHIVKASIATQFLQEHLRLF